MTVQIAADLSEGKVNGKAREGALGCKVNGKAKEGALGRKMQKRSLLL